MSGCNRSLTSPSRLARYLADTSLVHLRVPSSNGFRACAVPGKQDEVFHVPQTQAYCHEDYGESAHNILCRLV